MPFRLLPVLICITCILISDYSESQEIPRNVRWSEDIDYMIDRLSVTHPNLYANISKEAFHEHADQLRQRIPSASDVDMVFGIQELLARIKNAHTLCPPILFMNGIEELRRQFQYYPVMYYPFDDGLYVAATAEQYEAILGRKVVKIGRLTSEEAMQALAHFAAADNDMTTLANLPRFFLNDGQLLRYIGATDSSSSITLGLENDDGGTFEFEIRTDPNYGTAAVRWLTMATSDNSPPLYRRHRRENYWFEYLPEQQAVYLQINLMNDTDTESFADFCRRTFDTLDQNQAEKLIIDVRGCSGGDHIELPLLKGILARPQIDKEEVGKSEDQSEHH